MRTLAELDLRFEAAAAADVHPALREPRAGCWDEPASDERAWSPEAVAVTTAVSGTWARVSGTGAPGSSVRVSMCARVGERWFGFGERSDAIGRSVGCVENWVGEGPYQLDEYPLIGALTPRWALRQRRDATYYPVPWMVNTHGFGILVDSPELSRVRLGGDRLVIEIEAERLVLRLFFGKDIGDALRLFTDATGRQPFPQDPWFLGPWIQTGHADLIPFEREVEILERLRAADAPVSAIETHMRRLPAGAHEGRRQDERRRTELFHAAGLASLTYLNPFVAEDYVARFSEAEPLLQRRPNGSAYLFDAYIGGREPPVTREGQLDFSRPGAEAFFAALAAEAIEDGHDGWMEDFGEYTPPDAVQADSVRGDAAHNPYPVAYHAAGARAAAAAGRPIARFARSGWTGAAHHLPLVWGGDPTTGWGFDGLTSVVTQGLSAGLSGIGLWGCDIGGFFTLAGAALDAELLIRWIQLGALLPLMRTKCEGIAIPPRPRPQVWDADILPHWRRWAKLHTQLSPYLLGAAAQYVETGLPLMRHHVLEEASLAAVDDQYLLGDSLLVSPVLEPGITNRSVVLPAGEWVDAWRSLTYDEPTGGLFMRSASVIRGGRSVDAIAPLDEIPIFIRRGALLPLLPADVSSLVGSPEGRLRVLAYPAGSSEARFGRHGRLRSDLRAGEWSLASDGQPVRELDVEAALDFTPSTANAPFSFDSATGVVRARVRGSALRVIA